MIERLIRKYIKNYAVQLTESSLLSEADKKWEAPYIPAYNTMIGMKVDNAAQAAGARTGLPIISKRTRKGIYSESELDNLAKQVFAKAAQHYFPTNFDPETILFVYFNALDKTNKKVWNVWAIDKDETGINKLSKEIKQALQKTTYFAQWEQKIDKIQAVRLMTLDEANKWFTSLQEFSKKLNLETTLNLPKLNKIKTDVVGDDTQNITTQVVVVKNRIKLDTTDDGEPIEVDTGNYDIYDTDNNLIYSDVTSNGFTGTAKLSISSDAESLIIQPIEGRQLIIEFNTKRSGVFTGKFDGNGLPLDGVVEYEDAEEQQTEKFEGKLKSTVGTRSGKQSFTVWKLKGRATYGSGIIFDGEFKDDKPFDGDVFNKNKQSIGQIVNGEYKSGIRYPKNLEIDVDDIDGKNVKITVYKLNNNLYVYDIEGKRWGKVIDINKFENEDLYNQDVSIFNNIASITDTAEIKKLNNKFIPTVDNDGIPEPEETPPPTPKLKPAAKKKYVVFTTNTFNIYEFKNSEFVLYESNVPTESSDKTTGHLLMGTKTAKIKGGSSTQYKMYNIKVEVDSEVKSLYVPERFVKIVER
jgi:hypothetical protein